MSLVHGKNIEFGPFPILENPSDASQSQTGLPLYSASTVLFMSLPQTKTFVLCCT